MIIVDNNYNDFLSKLLCQNSFIRQNNSIITIYYIFIQTMECIHLLKLSNLKPKSKGYWAERIISQLEYASKLSHVSGKDF